MAIARCDEVLVAYRNFRRSTSRSYSKKVFLAARNVKAIRVPKQYGARTHSQIVFLGDLSNLGQGLETKLHGYLCHKKLVSRTCALNDTTDQCSTVLSGVKHTG